MLRRTRRPALALPLALLLTLASLDVAVFRTGLFDLVGEADVSYFARLADRIEAFDAAKTTADVVLLGNSHLFGKLRLGRSLQPYAGRPLRIVDLSSGGLVASNAYDLWHDHLAGPRAPTVLVYGLSFWTLQRDVVLGGFSRAGEERGGYLLNDIVKRRSLAADLGGLPAAFAGDYQELQLDLVWRDLSAGYDAHERLRAWLTRSIGGHVPSADDLSCCDLPGGRRHFTVDSLDDPGLSDGELDSLYDPAGIDRLQLDAFRRTVEGAKAVGTAVVVIVMPLDPTKIENTALLGATAPYVLAGRRIAARSGASFLFAAASGPGDLDSLFADEQHLSDIGASQATAVITERLWPMLQPRLGSP